MSIRTSPDEPYPVTGYRSPSSGSVPVEDPQTARLGTSVSGCTITPRPSAFSQEDRYSQPISSDVIHRGSNSGVPTHGAPEVGSDVNMGSYVQTWGRGDSLILVPPSRPVSRGAVKVE